jgi:hypothetical protein
LVQVSQEINCLHDGFIAALALSISGARRTQQLTSKLRTSDTLNVQKIRCIMTDVNVQALTMRQDGEH